MTAPPSPPALTLYHTGAATEAAAREAAGRAAALGFRALCVTRPELSGAAGGLEPWLDVAMDAEGPADTDSPPDPRFPGLHRPRAAPDPQNWLAHWEQQLGALQGFAGVLCRLPDGLDDAALRGLRDALRRTRPDLRLAAVAAHPRPGLEGFDFVAPALPWVDALPAAATWLKGPPLLALAELPGGRRLAARFGNRPTAAHALSRAIRLAALSGAGWLLPEGLEDGALHRGVLGVGAAPRLALAPVVRAANEAARAGGARLLSAPHAPLALLRQDGDGRALVLANPSLSRARDVAAGQWLGLLPAPGTLPAGTLDAEGRLRLSPAEVRILPIQDSAPVRLPPAENTALLATESPRIAIEAVSPAVDDGRFAVKRAVGQAVTVTADVFTDGHTHIAVRLLWRAADEADWRELPTTKLANDVYSATFVPERIGRHFYTFEAWVDVYAAFENEITKKHAAGIEIPLVRLEGVALVKAALARMQVAEDAGLQPHIAQLEKVLAAEPDATPGQAVALFTDPETRRAMHAGDARPFRERRAPLPLEVERRAAGFASWYEIFPRSQTDDPKRHGTLRDVIPQLPRVRDMGFDVLYFTPIHPIGKKNRKGRNNTLTPGPDDVGSPYAIGSEAGGHDALHPELGTLEDFQALVAAAKEHDLELALDFAIQCSPDHPWLKEHPDWFEYRPDGSIRYAENPPKRYEDIVNVDFYNVGAMPSLWIALRDAVLFWVRQGVTLFRVDNPHTKPLPFWEWMIAEVRAVAPEAVFLSEAFTRPKVMYRLAKVGYSQSYTYFTWRNEAWELRQYLEELNQAPVRDFFRPHFFVNTPDINPEFLQTSGRPGHLIRAGLAATLSGLWGVYNGFELCEATPVKPGKEEYLDSEKYEIKVWDYDRPGNIVPEITALNAIRRENPALQTHLGVTFLPSGNDKVLAYLKATPDGGNAVLVLVSMDPHTPVDCWYEVPHWLLGMTGPGAVLAENLLAGGEERWDTPHRHHRFDPHSMLPYAIWRLRAAV